jgi:hypothetical protein
MSVDNVAQRNTAEALESSAKSLDWFSIKLLHNVQASNG